MLFGKEKKQQEAEKQDAMNDAAPQDGAKATESAAAAVDSAAAEAAPEEPAVEEPVVEEPEAKDAAPANPDAERAAKLEADLALLKDAHLRLMADFENHRRRVARDREDLVKRANEDLMESLLPTLDAIDLALKQKPEGDDPFAKGIVMVFDLLRKALGDSGLEPIDAKGADFDPQIHEAIVYAPSPDVAEGKVMEQTRRGYKLNGRLLRAAQVVVSSGAPAAPAADAPAEPAK